jgi:hypothetical protein
MSESSVKLERADVSTLRLVSRYHFRYDSKNDLYSVHHGDGTGHIIIATSDFYDLVRRDLMLLRGDALEVTEAGHALLAEFPETAVG